MPRWLLRLLHWCGLTNLSDEDVDVYCGVKFRCHRCGVYRLQRGAFWRCTACGYPTFPAVKP